MKISVIKNHADYTAVSEEIDKLLDAPTNSPESERLELLSLLVEDYEERYYRIDSPDPIEAIKCRMEQLHLTRRDLETSIGPRSRVSDILNRKRPLTLRMIRKISTNLNIPASILIQEQQKLAS